jgi:hypothetical protein
LAAPAESRGIARKLDIGELEALVSPGQPRVPELVLGNGQGVISMGRIDVVFPHRAGLEKVLIGINDGHLCPRDPV